MDHEGVGADGPDPARLGTKGDEWGSTLQAPAKDADRRGLQGENGPGPLRVLVVIPTVHGGGAEKVASILSQEWANGHAVRVLAWHVGDSTLDFGVRIEDLRMRAQSSLLGKLRVFFGRARGIQSAVKDWDPDVVMAFMDEAGLACSAAALWGGWRDRLIVSMHHNPRWLGGVRRTLLAVA